MHDLRPAPLLLVPGLGLGGEAWAPTRRALGEVGSVVRTLPAYGVPAPRGQDLSPWALGAPLVDQADAADRLVLVGHSASCQVVVAAALSAPDRVAGLVLVGPTTDPRAATWPRLAARWLATAAWEDPRQVPALVAQYSRTGLGSMRRGMDAVRRHRLDEAVRGLSCPVLLLRGRHDRISPLDWARTVAREAPDGTVRTLPSGAHMVPQTRGPQVAAALGDFLGTLS